MKGIRIIRADMVHIRPRGHLAILCSLMLWSVSASGQTTHVLGETLSDDGKASLPLAQCVWKRRYREALAFIHQVERGLAYNEYRQALADLGRDCRPTAESRISPSDFATALHLTKNEQVASCMRSLQPAAFSAFEQSMRRGKKSDDAQVFIEKGFPSDLIEAVNYCDADLQKTRIRDKRTEFGMDIFHWERG